MKLQYLRIFSLGLVAILYSCGDDDPIGNGIQVVDPSENNPSKPDDDPQKPVQEYEAPGYADDYSPIAAWANHNQWNLANVHDPSVEYFDGYYYMYGTDASYGNEHMKASTGRHFQGKRSRDLVNWTYLPGPMNDAPAWVADSLNSIRSRMGLPEISDKDIQYGYWAPVVRKVNVNGQDRLRMYYCIVIDNYIKSGRPSSTSFDGSWTERAFIGMCESSDPANAVWEDRGFVTCSSSDKGRDGWGRTEGNWDGYFYYNAIDPTYIVTENNKHYLIHGSWHSGFALLEIDPASGKPVKELGEPWADNVVDLTSRFGVRVGTRKNGQRWQGSEAPEIIYKDGYYYLFMAYDALDVPYNTRVVRASSIEGPYYDINGTNFTAGEGDCYPIVTHPYKFNGSYGWVGISHCCIFKENNSQRWFYMSQGRLPANVGGNPYSNAIMMGHVRQIVWCPSSPNNSSDLWPIALPERYGAVPNASVKKDEIIGEWEHIALVYDYGHQCASNTVTFKENGTITGAISGRWSYDESKQWLTLSTDNAELVVVVARECDWEASPRRATIVYAGTAKDLNATWWGKKINN